MSTQSASKPASAAAAAAANPDVTNAIIAAATTTTNQNASVGLLARPLLGKVALVTGGSRGIGAGIVLALAEAGADVALSYSASADRAKEVVKEVESLGRRGLAVKADHAVQAEVEALVHSVAKHFGRLDILVNNAGISVNGSIIDAANRTPQHVAEIDRMFAINLTSVATAVRTATPILPDGAGRIITIGSILGENVFAVGCADYGASKAALRAYTKGWARDFGPRGITVNLVQPGPILSDSNPADGPWLPMIKERCAFGRNGTAAELGAAVVFLASPQASFVTSAILNVDGGMNA